ncbi:GlcNAc-PI de-N-acetylase [Mycolicibacterium rhodesiae NBB3]|uniref:GlcNAc-PI de-N-acetylase n=1 Tax=Mycolicibacterium rhodesiae (strain NBB3) TaxID=710685 RepID=G8RX41_MYCRN|nr:PIG-L family deacetylase [Mycolicibacterium rhodesiae]AEV71898.1 GlcNAc-PI de-N-acetylase [Mycolicibacterium rhodesiae NBB3]
MDVQNAILVAAHPDDEILWFSSIFDLCKSVIVCYGASASSKESWDVGRAQLMDTYPHGKVRFLKVRQSGGFDAANWYRPEEAESGLRLRGRVSAVYERNAEDLFRILISNLAPESVVITHNPWGEYGHEEHVQVFRVLQRLQERIGFDLFVDGYVSDRSAKLMKRSLHLLEGAPIVRETDRGLAHQLKNLYIEHDCWTFHDDFEWPEFEVFYRVRQPDGPVQKASVSVPLNLISRSFYVSPIKKLAKKLLPTSVQSAIRKAYK